MQTFPTNATADQFLAMTTTAQQSSFRHPPA